MLAALLCNLEETTTTTVVIGGGSSGIVRVQKMTFERDREDFAKRDDEDLLELAMLFIQLKGDS